MNQPICTIVDYQAAYEYSDAQLRRAQAEILRLRAELERRTHRFARAG